MQLILADVMSLDGRLTKWGGFNVGEWASAEDAAHLKETIQSCDAMILGRTTYEAVRPKPTAQIRRMVLTHQPKRFHDQEVPGQLEFVSAQPHELVERLRADGHRRILFLGGSNTATAFLEGNLIDEIWVTIEPYVFGQGLPFSQNVPLDVSLQLMSMQQLNARGTILLTYKVIKSS